MERRYVEPHSKCKRQTNSPVRHPWRVQGNQPLDWFLMGWWHNYLCRPAGSGRWTAHPSLSEPWDTRKRQGNLSDGLLQNKRFCRRSHRRTSFYGKSTGSAGRTGNWPGGTDFTRRCRNFQAREKWRDRRTWDAYGIHFCKQAYHWKINCP